MSSKGENGDNVIHRHLSNGSKRTKDGFMHVVSAKNTREFVLDGLITVEQSCREKKITS